MSTVSRYFWDFRTPLSQGLMALPLRSFVMHIPVGRIAEGGMRGCDRHSTCVASITEVTSAPGHPIDFPFIGAAPMAILNVAPRDDGVVDLWVYVDWHEQLNLRINLAIFNG